MGEADSESDSRINQLFLASCRIGTTVATNALLEHKGERFAFLTTQGMFMFLHIP
jgi:N-methylhydantoinase A/oxoprolinase/acetone carboxylase beta subunit